MWACVCVKEKNLYEMGDLRAELARGTAREGGGRGGSGQTVLSVYSNRWRVDEGGGVGGRTRALAQTKMCVGRERESFYATRKQKKRVLTVLLTQA